MYLYRGADTSLALPGKKQARKHVRDARNFNNIETRAVTKFLFLQGKVPKEIRTILTVINTPVMGTGNDCSSNISGTTEQGVNINGRKLCSCNIECGSEQAQDTGDKAQPVCGPRTEFVRRFIHVKSTSFPH